MVAACALVVSFAVFLCGHSSGVHSDDLPRKKPMASSSKKARPVSGTVVDTTGRCTAAYGVAVVGGCGGGCGGGGGGGGECGGGGGGGC
uniref:Secreted protein n=1 Tax=Oryza brachyantha TaxID=4533 RepID=J3MYI8_ORYBR